MEPWVPAVVRRKGKPQATGTTMECTPTQVKLYFGLIKVDIPAEITKPT